MFRLGFQRSSDIPGNPAFIIIGDMFSVPFAKQPSWLYLIFFQICSDVIEVANLIRNHKADDL